MSGLIPLGLGNEFNLEDALSGKLDMPAISPLPTPQPAVTPPVINPNPQGTAIMSANNTNSQPDPMAGLDMAKVFADLSGNVAMPESNGLDSLDGVPVSSAAELIKSPISAEAEQVETTQPFNGMPNVWVNDDEPKLIIDLGISKPVDTHWMSEECGRRRQYLCSGDGCLACAALKKKQPEIIVVVYDITAARVGLLHLPERSNKQVKKGMIPNRSLRDEWRSVSISRKPRTTVYQITRTGESYSITCMGIVRDDVRPEVIADFAAKYKADPNYLFSGMGYVPLDHSGLALALRPRPKA